jgi:hypothetical protein
VGGGLSLIRGFSGPPLHVYPVAYKEKRLWSQSEMKENLYKGPQFTFFPFIEKV